jgi:hypothetical protein
LHVGGGGGGVRASYRGVEDDKMALPTNDSAGYLLRDDIRDY